MALGSTQPLIEMSTRNLPGRKEQPARKADSLTAICEPIVYKMWEPRRLTTLWPFTACYRDSFTFFYLLLKIYKYCAMKPYTLTRMSQSRINKYMNIDVNEAEKMKIKIIERETEDGWFI
jgi:hypothetical protein